MGAAVAGFGRLRSKRSRVRVAPGPLWTILPRRYFGIAGFFVGGPDVVGEERDQLTSGSFCLGGQGAVP